MYKENGERMMAWVASIDEVKSIEGADKIQAYRVGGWWVVDQKDKYLPEDVVIYVSIDSWVPTEIAPFLSKGAEPREYNGVKGERLRTVKLRGQISQGLILDFPAKLAIKIGAGPGAKFTDYIGQDMTEVLGIQKWEAPISPQLAGQVKGSFPSFIRKTDQERIQNCFGDVAMPTQTDQYEVTIKLDGSSCTIFYNEGELGVCSRNLQLKINEENKENSFVKMAQKVGPALEEYCKKHGRNLALQGELMGPGIQGNREGFKDTEFFVFDIFDIDAQEYLGSLSRHAAVAEMDLKHVPVYGYKTLTKFNSVDDFLAYAEVHSINHKIAEGLVFKNMRDPSISFKAISNTFLLKGGE